MTGTARTPMLHVDQTAKSTERVPCAIICGVRASMATLTGTDHALNQDFLLHLPGQFSGVADGVGGGAHGEVASRMLMQLLAEQAQTPEGHSAARLTEIDRLIQSALVALGHGPGASVFASVSPLPATREWQAMWVGDCQITHFEKTHDGWRVAWQSQSQTYRTTHDIVPNGVDPESPSNMVGCGLNFPAGHHRFRAGHQDRIVMASDGFHKVFSVAEQLSLIAQATSPLNMDVAQTWCELARQRGSQDDISVLILEMTPPRFAIQHWGGLIAVALALAGLAWFNLPGWKGF